MLFLPPIGAAKQQPTPTAQAADSISVFLSSFCTIGIRYTHARTHTKECSQGNTDAQIPTGAQCMYLQRTPARNTQPMHLVMETKVTRCLQMRHCQREAAAVSFRSRWDHMYERGEVGGHNWKARSDVEIMEWDVCTEAKAAQIDVLLWRFAEQHQTKMIHLSQLQKWMPWITNVNDIGNEETLTCAFIPCFPQRALPLAVKVKKNKDRNMCECDRVSVEVTFHLCSWRTSSLLAKAHKNQTSEDWASANTALVPRQTELTFSLIDKV